MMKYVINREKNQIMAYLTGTRFDAIHKVVKEMQKVNDNIDYYSTNLLMANKYSGTVTLREGDTWNEEEGKRLAKEKCLANYRRGLEKRLNRFYYEMAQVATYVIENKKDK